MTDQLATASVLIRPDTTKFRALLEAELVAATRGITVPIPVVALAAGGAASTKALTASTALATEATVAQTAALESAGAAAAKKGAADVALANATKLAAAAEAQLAAVAEAGALSTTNLAKARAELRASTAAVAKSEAAVAAALAAGNIELITAAGTTRQLAVAQEAAAVTAFQEAKALTVSSAAAAKSAAAHEQLTRGVSTAGLSFVGLRAATLASSAPFLAGTVAALIFAKSIKEASREEEALAAVTRIVGVELGKNLERSARGLATSFGLSAVEALKAEAAIGTVFRIVGVTRAETAQFSEQLVKLAADLAAVREIPVEAALKGIQLALGGNLRGLRQFGIIVSGTEVKQLALAQSGKTAASELTRQELVMARLTLILKDAAISEGAFAARSGDAAGQGKILQANIANLSAEIGSALLPVLGELEKDLNFVFLGLNKLHGPLRRVKQEFGELPGPIKTATHFYKEFAVTVALGPVVGPIRLLRNAIQGAGDAAVAAGPKAGVFTTALENLESAALAAANALASTQRAADNLSFARAGAKITGLDDDLKNLIIAGQATPAARLAILQKQRADALDQLASANTPEEIRGARDKAAGFSEQITTIQEQQAAAAQSAADAAKAAADKLAADAQAARDKQDAAFQTLFGLAEGRHQIKLIFINATVQVKDDIREALRWISVLKQWRETARKTIHDVVLRAQIIQQLTAAIATETIAIRGYRKTIADNARAHREALREQRRARIAEREEALQLNIQIAEASGNVKKELAARRAHLRDLEKRIAAAKKGTNAWRRLVLEAAQEKAAIKDLLKETQDKGKAFAALSFEFLQQQQGFAANLLSNILPASAFAGTVGGTSGPGGVGSLLPFGPGGQGRGEGATAGISQAAQTADARQRGVTQGQAATTNDILRAILRVLKNLDGERQHPEAKRQRISGSAVMDIL